VVHDVDPRLQGTEVDIPEKCAEDDADEGQVDDRCTADGVIGARGRHSANQAHRAHDEHHAAEQVRQDREIAEEADQVEPEVGRDHQLRDHAG